MHATSKPVNDLTPLNQDHQESVFEKRSDHLAWIYGKGDFKRFSQTGLACIDPESFT